MCSNTSWTIWFRLKACQGEPLWVGLHLTLSDDSDAGRLLTPLPPRSSPEARLSGLSLSQPSSIKDRPLDTIVPELVGVVDNGASVAPKAAHAAMSILSLLAAHRPVEVLGCLDVEPLSKALYR